MGTKTSKKEKSKVDEILSSTHKLILENDDYNTFDWVIKCLMRICGHDYEQADQCALIVHNNGRCVVKYGDRETINIMKEKLKNAGLCATVEDNDL